ncbi:MAG: tRNA (N6-threonylcarbamoyladenosine(37)-N6)-methyltransferase TrmO [Bacteroidota bacterium]
MSDNQTRPGELVLALDPAKTADDARLVFIGRIRTPWRVREDAPKNPRRARERGGGACVEIDAPYRAGLQGLEKYSHVIVLYWMDRARRDLIVQAPKHRATPCGVFALRSPVRPNPIALAVVRVLAIDAAAGRIEIDAIDCLDATPLLDIKPYRPGIDAVPEATTE